MLRTLKDFEKCAIGATDGDIGHVKDLYFDDQAWTIRYLVVDPGSWLVGRKVLISPVAIHEPDWPAHRLPVAISQDQVKNSPDIDTDQPVTRQHELRYLGYYGYAVYWGGAGLWDGGLLPLAKVSGPAELPLGTVAREQAVAGAEAERKQHRDDDSHLRSCKAVVGYHLHAGDGEMGHVEGFLIDDETWAVRFLVVDTSNWWFGHQVLLAPQWIRGVRWSDRTTTVDLSREAVKAAPRYDSSAELDRQSETELYAHYGRAPYGKTGSTPGQIGTAPAREI